MGDKAQVAADAHGCPSCPHPAVGPITVGSPDVNINKKPAARLDDIGAHAVCCGPNNFSIVKGTLKIVDGKGNTVSIGAPRNGAANTTLHDVGASYRVKKLVSNEPHWSDNGH